MADIPIIIASAAALGTASFGIVEGFKGVGRSNGIGLFGFGVLEKAFWDSSTEKNGLGVALEQAYGADCRQFLKDQYRDGRSKGPLRTTIRQGVRVGMTSQNAGILCETVGNPVSASQLKKIAVAVMRGTKLTDSQRNVLGRFELAMDARLDALFSRSDSVYRSLVQLTASTLSITLALIATIFLIMAGEIETKTVVVDGKETASFLAVYLSALLIGIIAVPIAPIAKDVTKAITEASKAIKASR